MRQARSSPAGPALAPPPPAVRDAVGRDLLAWYDRSRRVLPWRALPHEIPDPYAVWLSEIMLQQTTVEAVKPYFGRFLTQWPTVESLAAAPVEDVMRLWAGLGYYSRARNLHACAQAVVREHGGQFPAEEAGLRALPGIGAYTAAAIAAIAFGRDATVVDGNVERVMARLFAIDAPPDRAKPVMRLRMGQVTPPSRAGDFAQGVMDLGSTICTPRNPACTICPLTRVCLARQQGLQTDLPRRKPRVATRLRHGTAYYITDREGRVLVRRRPPTGLLGGMVELPGTPWLPVEAEPPGGGGRVTHTFTHFTLFLDVRCGEDALLTSTEKEECWWLDRESLDREALPTLMRHAVELGRAVARR